MYITVLGARDSEVLVRGILTEMLRENSRHPEEYFVYSEAMVVILSFLRNTYEEERLVDAMFLQ